MTFTILDRATAEIHVEAAKGGRVDDALAEATILALTEHCRVLLRFNDRMYPINPSQVIDDVKRRLEGKPEGRQ